MVPTTVLVDFSEIAYDSLCKLKYDKHLHLHYDIPVVEKIEQFLYGGFVDPVLPGRAEK